MAVKIQIENLHKVYGSDVVAVDDVALMVEPGELVTILGPSGCGKTTTLRCIAGLEVPDRGTIKLGDRTVFSSEQTVNVPVHKRNLAMMFQSYALWPHLTVQQNVAYPLQEQGVRGSERDAKVEAALERVQLSGLGKRWVHELSGGQQQRVALARCLASDPNLILFDEPLSNLDARLRHEMRLELRRLQVEIGFSALYVTHDQEEAMAISDRMILMRSGNVVQDASPQEVYRHPTDQYVAQFLGANVLTGHVLDISQDGTARVAVGDSVLAGGVAGGLSSGEAVCVSFPPPAGRLRFMDVADVASNDATNMVAGRVLVASYTGGQMVYDILTEFGKVEVHMSEFSDDRSGGAPSSQHFSHGDDVVLEVDVADTVVVPR